MTPQERKKILERPATLEELHTKTSDLRVNIFRCEERARTSLIIALVATALHVVGILIFAFA